MSDQPFHDQGPTQPTRDVAVEETKSVGDDAKEGARNVAQTAGAEAQAVMGEARAQVSTLYDQVRHDVTGQARDQTQRAAHGLHGLAGELSQMADGTPQAGMAAGLARQAGERIDAAASWLEGREPADLLEEVRRYARRNPGTFLAACAVVGFVGGRLTRGLRDDSQEQQAVGGGQAGTQALAPAVPAPPPQPMDLEPGYGGRPSAVPGGIPDGSGMPVAAGTPTAPPVGTAAGHPLPGGPVAYGTDVDGVDDVVDPQDGGDRL